MELKEESGAEKAQVEEKNRKENNIAENKPVSYISVAEKLKLIPSWKNPDGRNIIPQESASLMKDWAEACTLALSFLAPALAWERVPWLFRLPLKWQQEGHRCCFIPWKCLQSESNPKS